VNVEPVKKIVMVQGLLILVMVIAAMATGLFVGSSNVGWVRAYSGLAGGLACLLPGLYIGLRLRVRQDVSVQDGSDVARRAVVQMLTAEAGKWAVTIVLMLMTFRFVQPLSAGWYFGVLALTFGAYIMVPLGEYRRQRA
tara:strand:- start:97 stop:513 length:417 start_codon:yes stop_codon:yes gene_type:complete